LRQAGGQAFHVAQQALDHLFEVPFALAQIGIFHVVELTRHHFKL
jgi:hypothetical protein